MIVYIITLIFIVFFYSNYYKNVEKVTIEARLPIYEAAAVYEFEVKIDGQKKIKGVVKKQRSRKGIYRSNSGKLLFIFEIVLRLKINLIGFWRLSKLHIFNLTMCNTAIPVYYIAM